ncbi:ABC transporter ATP-binding protein [Williamsia serinedens]|uniref:Osmoprotectant transport system ATP-binding protein n=1 Tax=Williamsia serinedens TaxID=391736 RepID=A0ABT1GY05_9NOCA|nr:ATP-binding cassette domain-containing protein [Williamsia serinedens]MCP2159869.1 osmoprotectant transport system ATP-binding protein [Williamsia serinedens]
MTGVQERSAATSSTEKATGVEIVLDHVSKRYPGQQKAAVEDVSMTIGAGEIVVFVGPSGCGKTTTMRMINRLIEPTSGSITIGGRDALSIPANELRRSIGYSIQQAGLFPHMTIEQNVSLVPGLLKWDKKRVAARVEEMLSLVGLDPAIYARRFPRQLSGGQQQRVGVARALAADPPVLLMDEPFGAVDPITRASLQDELIRLHAEIGTTIVFVTHDFAEAVKLGDKIAVLGDQSSIQQYDTPEAILANPATEMVEGFVGKGALLQQLGLQRVRDVQLEKRPSAHENDPVEQLARAIDASDDDWGVIVDDRDRPVRWVRDHHLRTASNLRDVGVPADLVSMSSTLQQALEAILSTGCVSAIVTGRNGRYEGVVVIETLMSAIRDLRGSSAAEPA